MGKLQTLFGSSSRWLSIVSWMSILLALSGAIVPLLFIIYVGFISGSTLTDIGEMRGIWGDPRFIQATINSFILAITISVLLTFVSALAALIFRWSDITGSRLIYSISIIPLLIPDYVFGVVGRVMFDPSIGIIADWLPSGLLINRFSSIAVVALVSFIKWIPIMIVVVDSSLFSMGDNELYQVRMDYRSFSRAARFVYIPKMKEVLLIVASLGFLIGFRQHELAYELTSGGAGFAAETWSCWNYRVMFDFAKLSQAAVESLLILVLLTIPIQIIRKQAQRLCS